MNEMMKKYGMSLVSGIVILFVGIGLGSMISRGGSAGTPNGEPNTFQAGWDAAKKRLSESGFGFPSPVEMTSVSGIVQDISASGMAVKIRLPEPLSDPSLDARMVTFDAHTKFYQIKQKDPVQYQEEVKAFNAKIQALMGKAGSQTPSLDTPPPPFTKIQISAQDIKKDMSVTVTAGNNIKDAKTFVATEVTVQTSGAPAAKPSLAQ